MSCCSKITLLDSETSKTHKNLICSFVLTQQLSVIFTLVCCMCFPPKFFLLNSFENLQPLRTRANLTLPVLKAYQLILVFYYWKLRVARYSLVQELPSLSQYWNRSGWDFTQDWKLSQHVTALPWCTITHTPSQTTQVLVASRVVSNNKCSSCLETGIWQGEIHWPVCWRGLSVSNCLADLSIRVKSNTAVTVFHWHIWS